MGKVIEVYIKNEEVLTGGLTQVGRPIGDHYCTAHDTYKTMKVISEADAQALKIVGELAREGSFEVKQYDISTFKGRIKALSKGIKNTPTIVVGEEKKEGVLEIEKYLLSLVRKL